MAHSAPMRGRFTIVRAPEATAMRVFCCLLRGFLRTRRGQARRRGGRAGPAEVERGLDESDPEETGEDPDLAGACRHELGGSGQVDRREEHSEQRRRHQRERVRTHGRRPSDREQGRGEKGGGEEGRRDMATA